MGLMKYIVKDDGPGDPTKDQTPVVGHGQGLGSSGKKEADIAALLSEFRPKDQAPDIAAPTPGVPEQAPLIKSGVVDCNAVFKQAGLNETSTKPFEKASVLIRSLPPGQSDDVARQFVTGALAAFDVKIGDAHQAGSNMVVALDAFASRCDAELKRTREAANERLTALNKEIEEVNQLLDSELTQYEKVSSQIQAQRSSILKVLAFLGWTPPAQPVKGGK